jgi:SAM-dependent methyltransferase
MQIPEDYIETNKKTWNNKTDVHIASDFYNNADFLKGKSSLMDIEMKLLRNVSGKKILHLQCHFGQDTLSLTRLGAKVTGVDLSDNAISKAREFNQQLHLDAEFICCDIYDLADHLNEKFDIVFTSYGTIGWLPDLDKWAKVVSYFLKPRGQFIFAEFHPVVWMYDNDFKEVFYSYFNIEPIIEYEEGTYANREADIKTSCVCWNHPTGEVLNSLIRSGLEINSFDEYDYSPYNCFNKTEEFEKGKFRIKHLQNKIPMVFSLAATKK